MTPGYVSLCIFDPYRESPGDRKKAKKHPKREVVDKDSEEDEDSEDDWEEVEGNVSSCFPNCWSLFAVWSQNMLPSCYFSLKQR